MYRFCQSPASPIDPDDGCDSGDGRERSRSPSRSREGLRAARQQPAEAPGWPRGSVLDAVRATAWAAGGDQHGPEAGLKFCPPGSQPATDLRFRFAVGDQVVLTGLRKRPEFNGRFAKVIDLCSAGGQEKYVVLLGGEDRQLSVKGDNVRQLSASAEPPARTPSDGAAPTDDARSTVPGVKDSTASAERKDASAPAVLPSDQESPSEKVNAGAGGPEAKAASAVAAAPAGSDRGGPSEEAASAVAAAPAGSDRGGPSEEAPRPLASDDKGGVGPPKGKPRLLHKPIVFVRAQEAPQQPIAASAADAASGSDDDDDIAAPRRVAPRRAPAPAPENRGPSANEPEHRTATSAAAPHVLGELTGNLTLTISKAAQEEDRASREMHGKRSEIEASRLKMLEKLTQQLQLLLQKVQAGNLSESNKEKYQDMIATVKAQMAKISASR